MKGTTQLIGFTGAIGGAFLVDCAIKGNSPFETLKAIIGNPGDTHTILNTKGNAYPSDGEPINLGGGIQQPGGGGTDAPVLIQRVMAYWVAQLGKPYCHAGVGPSCYDCSGLMWAAYKTQFVSIPRTTAGMLVSTSMKHITRLADCKPGDIILPYPGHCFGYIGNGMMIEAPHTGTTVHKAKVYKFWTARRPVNW